ncbi:MAG TPA: hypothetical protein PKC62_02870 [Ferruginibacter sp.]|jgi:membrane-associated PAP2 superfamily phosphatase|nr:hypothetical protein [Bacteroidota bacterium]MBS1926737.1 hypothetical protein [Bacteroidota bacterium]MCC6691764.1 hypothetical protein [Chitinophagaceae bacterium]HMT95604.1 hypothetical protein [Ferruginibacter sp.]HMU24804.1 hypothetical protein [Ferruginibacter sp.]
MKTIYSCILSICFLTFIQCNAVKSQIVIGSIEKNSDGSYNPSSAKFTVDMQPYLKTWSSKLKNLANIEADLKTVELGIYEGSAFLRARSTAYVSTTNISLSGNNIVILKATSSASCTTKCCSSSTTECILLMGGTCTKCSCNDCVRTQSSASFLLEE